MSEGVAGTKLAPTPGTQRRRIRWTTARGGGLDDQRGENAKPEEQMLFSTQGPREKMRPKADGARESQ